jgi:hypothetical protein
MDCTYDGAQVGTVSSSFQHFAEWLGLYGLDVFLAVAEELEMQEHAMMDFNQMPLDEAANY